MKHIGEQRGYARHRNPWRALFASSWVREMLVHVLPIPGKALLDAKLIMHAESIDSSGGEDKEGGSQSEEE